MTDKVLAHAARIVVKIGSSLLADSAGNLNEEWLAGLAEDVRMLRQDGRQVAIVSSGAVAIGSRVMDIDPGKSKLEELQAAAAAGQTQLVNAYQGVLARHGISAAQVLLTPDDTEVRRRFLNARGTMETLLKHGIVPIINENDTVATEELRYGDNDRLAARVAQMVMAEAMVLLSDVDGFYTADPSANPNAEYMSVVSVISDEMMSMAGDPHSVVGRGGMKTKLLAARMATRAGCSTYIGSGKGLRPLMRLVNGGKHTFFPAQSSPAAARKRWLTGILEVSGELIIDAGAIRALTTGKSLLPVGLVNVSGEFNRGDAVSLLNESGSEIGRGLVAYAHDEAQAILGRHSADIESVLGYRGRNVLVHRDDLVMFETQ